MSAQGTPPPPPPSGGYGNYPQGPGGPAGYGGGAPGQPPNNYLVWSILSTVFCCLPLGVASIVFSAQVNGKWAMGDVAGANDSANKAKKFAIWAAIAGVIVLVLYVVLIVAGAVSLSGSTSTY